MSSALWFETHSVAVLLTTVPLRLFAVWAQGRIAVGVGTLLRKRLLAGALRIDPDSIRREGAGQLLGRAMEAGAIEALALGAGFTAALGGVEIITVLVVLGIGAAGPWHAVLLGACTLLTAIAGWRAYRRRAHWAARRRAPRSRATRASRTGAASWPLTVTPGTRLVGGLLAARAC